VVIFRQPSIVRNLICPLATRLKSKIRSVPARGRRWMDEIEFIAINENFHNRRRRSEE
jgi:hypothetical protein